MENDELLIAVRHLELEATFGRFWWRIVAACRMPAEHSRVLMAGVLDGRGPDRGITMSFVFVAPEYMNIQQTLSRM